MCELYKNLIQIYNIHDLNKSHIYFYFNIRKIMNLTENNSKHDFTLLPMKKVLVALDFDPSASKVAEAGYSLAKAMNAEIVLLHVVADDVYYSSLEYSPITGFSGFSNSDFSLMASSEGLTSASQYYLDQTKIHLGDENIQTIIDKGEFWEVIIETAKRTGADLIVMGSHSRRWLDQILMGSVTEKVLHNTTIPMLIIPTKGQDSKK
jgi:nucleotide-binding universal stress UspA family protein